MKKTIAGEVLIPEVAVLIREGRTVTLTARGHSMNPFIVHDRDRIVLSPCEDSDLQPGAVVLAETDAHRYVLHRIVRRRGNSLLLQGDGNVRQTEQTDTGRVLARMTAVIRKEQTYPTDGTTWKLYSCVWRWLTPVRRWLLAAYRRK